MGASEWRYWVPYSPDPARALEQLRTNVFAAGDYYLGSNSTADLIAILDHGAAALPEQVPQEVRDDPEYLDWLLSDVPTDPEQLARFRELAALEAPRTIDELRMWNADAGTHSILDCDRIAGAPAPGAIWVPPTTWLEARFGTPTPSHQQIDDQASSLLDARWHGLALTAHEAGTPSEYCFIGFSGD